MSFLRRLTDEVAGVSGYAGKVSGVKRLRINVEWQAGAHYHLPAFERTVASGDTAQNCHLGPCIYPRAESLLRNCFTKLTLSTNSVDSKRGQSLTAQGKLCLYPSYWLSGTIRRSNLAHFSTSRCENQGALT